MRVMGHRSGARFLHSRTGQHTSSTMSRGSHGVDKRVPKIVEDHVITSTEMIAAKDMSLTSETGPSLTPTKELAPQKKRELTKDELVILLHRMRCKLADMQKNRSSPPLPELSENRNAGTTTATCQLQGWSIENDAQSQVHNDTIS